MVIATAIASISIGAGAPVGQPGRRASAPSVGHISHGAPVATLSIPRLRFRGVVRQGVDADVLQYGPGHYPSTALPGRAGTTAFAGHRVTHTHPFLRINELRLNDLITVTTRWGRVVYRVYRERIVPVTGVWVLRDVGFQQLVLTACHPPHSALKRYVVFARRVR